jgi:hypothetical protein
LHRYPDAPMLDRVMWAIVVVTQADPFLPGTISEVADLAGVPLSDVATACAAIIEHGGES